MLELKNISKVYKTKSISQTALSNIKISFRKCEFLSILGPSGSGKTTLLNIIGGLDKYTSGDMIVDGVSTKDFKDSDWDTYRNHRVGFVFQSYNLIAHQTVLKNVELALTLGGVGKKERERRAKEALAKVGLSRHLKKHPNELSGGQMQRVAIARAIVNNPDIILADEPTGALDSLTSIQIMEILKEISQTKLVVMVTHNPELAEKYSSRIVNIVDGKIIKDTNPYENKVEKKSKIKKKKTSMNFIRALSLSFNNLLTKKGRTLLTSFAGSIGIIGIALILSLSNGVDNYINKTERETLDSYPLTIKKEHVDANIFNMEVKKTSTHENDKVYASSEINNMVNQLKNTTHKNNLSKLKEYLDKNDEVKDYAREIDYSYNVSLDLYDAHNKNSIVKVNPTNIMNNFVSDNFSMGEMSILRKISSDKNELSIDYELLAGKYPEKYNEIVLILDSKNEVSDYLLYALNIKKQSELIKNLERIKNNEKIESSDKDIYEYSEFLDKEFKLLVNSDYFENEKGMWIYKKDDITFLKKNIDNKETVKIVGVIKEKKENTNNSEGRIGYLKELEYHAIEKINASKIARDQEKNKSINVLTKKAFTSQNGYNENLKLIGVSDKNDPSEINIYPKDFAAKEKILNLIDEYNNKAGDDDKIKYTDYVGLLMSGVTSIVDVVKYVLIAFTSISLIVSSIMIGIITYISVLERTKEIGILRSLGARKKDVSRVFNAETFIIGLASGILGVSLTAILNVFINKLIFELTDTTVNASLPFVEAVALVTISVFLTVIAGLIPAKIASKKDPVVALRAE
mgnify:FL=1